MFSLGMVVYLYTAIDTTVATIVALTTGATAFFYVITNLLSVLYEVCPFGTQISHSTRRILKFVANHWTYAQRWKHLFVIKKSRSPYQTTEQDLHALRWLASNAQDPLVGDRFRSTPSPSEKSNVSLTSAATANDSEHRTSNNLVVTPGRKEKLITNMFVDICQRIREAPTAGAHELEVSCGTSVARYAATLPRLVNYLQPHPKRELLIKLANARRSHLELPEERFDPPKQALHALDAILDNNCPPFTADAYAWITASELRLVTDIANSIKSTRNSRRYTGDSQLFTDWDSKSQQTRPNSNAVEAGFGMIHRVDPKHNSEANFFELRARYSRSLARASFQMFFHSNDRAPMSAFSLISLLRSLEKAAQCEDLNQTIYGRSHPLERRLSTHHPQNPNASTKLPDFNIFLVGAGDSYELRSGEIGDPCGLIAGILDILGASGTRNVAGVEAAAANALNVIAPMLIEQLLGTTPLFSDLVGVQAQRRTGSVTIVDMTNRNSQHGIEWAPPPPSGDPETVPRSPIISNSPLQSPRLPGTSPFPASNDRGWPIYIPYLSMTHWSLGQMIVLAAFAKSHKEIPGIGELSRLSLRAFNHRFQSCFPRSTAFSIASTYLFELRYFVDHFDPLESTVTDPESANTHLLQILALKEDRTVYSTLLANDLGTPSQLLRIMQSAFAPPPATIETLLSDVCDSASSYWPYFAESGNSDDQGFTQLLKLGDRHAYRPGVARCIFKLVQTAATPTLEYPNGPGVTIGGLPAFFEATRFVLNHHAANPKKPLDLYKFIENVFKVVRVIDRKHDELIKDIIPRKEIKGFIKTISKNTPLKKQVQKDLVRFEDKDAKNAESKPDDLSSLAASAYDPLLKFLTEFKRQAGHEQVGGPAPKDIPENE
ncbi:hypothetical protein BDV93DRAFT_593875 [Ceratobasidium sp. AG-I]|nr:hypothetical protein BDV93DRAFT_593875 [Ceratobasidium sp. AG-I]